MSAPRWHSPTICLACAPPSKCPALPCLTICHASGLAVGAFSAPPAGSTLAVPSGRCSTHNQSMTIAVTTMTDNDNQQSQGAAAALAMAEQQQQQQHWQWQSSSSSGGGTQGSSGGSTQCS